MTLLAWRPEYSIGVPDIDHEHRELIGWIDTLLQDLHLDVSHQDRIEQLLGEIHARIAAHFALEEKIMRDTHYLAMAEHKQDHERLLDELRDLMEQPRSRDQFDATQLAARMTAWFTNHFRTMDAKFHHPPTQS